MLVRKRQAVQEGFCVIRWTELGAAVACVGHAAGPRMRWTPLPPSWNWYSAGKGNDRALLSAGVQVGEGPSRAVQGQGSLAVPLESVGEGVPWK